MSRSNLSARHGLPAPQLLALLVFLLLAYGLWFSTQTFATAEGGAEPVHAQNGVAAGQAPFDIVDTDPQPSAFAGVLLSNTVSATFNGDLDTATVAANFVVRGSQQGRFNGLFSYDGNSRTLTFGPNRPFAFGEQVSVVGSNAIRNSTGDALTPYQWNFKAGYIQKRCIQGFFPLNEFTPVWSSATAWADYDGDGDLDVLIAGKPLIGNPITRLYRNDDGHFTPVDFGLIGVREASVAWGDYDNDYDPDLLISGTDAAGRQVTQLYRNEAGTGFSRITTSLTPVTRGGVRWVDYDNDGLLDVFLHGDSSSGSIARLYRNTGNNNFTEVTTNFPGVNNSAAEWADYDNDGDPDLLLTGISGVTYISRLYNNNGGIFTEVPINLPPVGDSAVAWGDFDGDGDEDIVISGETNAETSAPVTAIYRNDGGGVFTNLNAGLRGVLEGSVAWGDFDNDGDLDLLVGGKDATEAVSTTLYRNQGGSFVIYPAQLPGINLGSLSWGDFDGDYDTDILLTGFSVSDTRVLAAAAAGESIVTTLLRNYDCPSDVAITQTIVPTTVLTSQVVTPQPITITLTFTNAGPVTATKVLIKDLIPNDITVTGVVSSTNDSSVKIVATGTAPDLRWRVSDLLVGQGGMITITGSLNPTVGAVYSNTAEIYAAKDITLTDNVATAQIVVPFHVSATTPTGGDKVGTPLDSPLGLVFETAIRPTSVTNQALRLYGSHSGYLGQRNNSYDAGSRAYQFNANRTFVQGETVTAIGTAAIVSLPGAPLIPYQWQFVAGKTIDRCVGDFVAQGTGLPGLEAGAVAWGDYDRDGDADLLLSGQSSQGLISRIYRNDGANRFTDIGAPLTGVRDGTALWVDYDADGDLDLFLSGSNGSNPQALLYRNEGGAFVAVTTGFTGVTNSAAAWLDYNNDGFLDLVLSGQSSGGLVTLLYRNNAGVSFTLINAGFPGLSHGAVAGADYDNDGDIDLLLTGNNGSNPVTTLYRNDNGTYTPSGISLTGLTASAAAWGDYDKDGDPDLLLTGNDGANNVTLLYNNDGGNFNLVPTTLPGLANGTVAWGDYDNDGVLDLLLSGATVAGRVTAIYRNANGTFTEHAAGLTAVATSAVAWGDYDGDADLDVLVLGNDGTGAVTKLYRNTDCISDLQVVKHASAATALAGDTITYTIVFTNAGPQPARNVVISDNLPADLTNLQIVSTTIGAGVTLTDTAATTGKRWLVSDLAINEGGMITLTAEVLPGTPGALFYNLVTVTATHDITPTNNLGVAAVGRPFHITETLPALAQVGFPINGALTATFDADVDPFTASDQSVLVYGEQSGWRRGTVGYNEFTRSLAFTPTTRLHHGESVNVIGTAAVASLAGAPLQPYQWHFVAAEVDPERCLAGFGAVTVPFPALTKSSAAWADYDRDGDLDLLLTGSTDGTNRTIKLYRNDGNSRFTEIPTNLAAVHNGAVAWGDYDRDGDPDLVVTGSGSSGLIAKIYRNDNGTFVDLNAPLTAVRNSAAAWGDYDNDGDLDLLLSGTTDGTTGLSQLYRNDSGIFTAVATPLPGLHRGSVQWGDYDADGHLDLLIAGTADGSNALTQIYRNDGLGGFVDTGAALPGIYDGVATWSDYDGDNDLDLFVTGRTTGGGRIAHLLRNDGSSFSDLSGNSEFIAVDQANVQWGDYNNDGASDLLIAGSTDGTTPSVQLMVNIGNDNFLAITTVFTDVHSGTALWGDYDGDRDLDLLLTGTGSSGPTMQLYRSLDCTSDLAIVKSVTPASVLPGEFVTYTLAIQNIGPQVATRVVLTNLIAFESLVELTVDSSLPLTQIGPPYIWQLPNIAPETGGTIQIRGRASYEAMGTTINNTATIYAREDVTPTNNVSSAAVIVRAPELNFAAATAEVGEDGGSATITVTLSEPNYAGSVIVRYQSSGGTATPGSDYTAVNNTLFIPPGQRSATFTVPIIEDVLDEANETVLLTLSDLSGAVFGARAQMRLIIVDNDPPPTLAVSGGTVLESAGVVEFTFTLSAASGQPITLTVSTVNGTATAPSDFIALNNVQIVIPSGATTAKISVTLVDDDIEEGPEEFYLSVSAINATLLANQAGATILDNDQGSGAQEFRMYMPVIHKR